MKTTREFPTIVVAAIAGVFGFASVSNGDIVGPQGIYVLGSARDNPGTSQDERLSNIRDYEFVDGYTLRLSWQDVDLGGGVYDFSVIDSAIGMLQANQHATKLNLEMLIINPPQYVDDAASEIWENSVGGVVPVPWDPAIQQAHANLVQALAGHAVFDAAAGTSVPLSQHSALESLNASIPGISSVRDSLGGSLPRLVDHVGYTRQKFVDAVSESTGRTRAAFSDKSGFLGYFGMDDAEDAIYGESLDDTLLSLVLTEFNNPGQPSLGLFQELLSDAGPNANSSLGQNLLAVSDETYIMFQALTSWQQPFTGADKVTSMNPATGIQHGFDTYGATFFELYIADIDGASNGAVDAIGTPLFDDLVFWHNRLAAVPEPVSGDFDADGDVDCDDLDGYVGNLGSTVTAELALLDLDNDGTVSAIDANTHITTLVQTSNGRTGTFRGDLNCDGTVDVLGDAFALIGNLGNSVASYSQGDINFDGTVSVLGDAFILVGNLGRTNEP